MDEVQEGVSSTFIGASRPEQVTENAVVSGGGLDDEVLKAVDDVALHPDRPRRFEDGTDDGGGAELEGLTHWSHQRG